MFHHIEGVVTHIGPNTAVIDCGGIGFEINVSNITLAAINKGEREKLYIYDYVREDVFDLYGFKTPEEKHLFQLLLGISGIGPKVAISVLSSGTSSMIISAIVTEDSAFFQQAPGIGKKTAHRIILELKDKVGGMIESAASDEMINAGQGTGDNKLKDARAALVSLGYTPNEISASLRGVDTASLSVSDIVRAALKKMSQ